MALSMRKSSPLPGFGLCLGVCMAALGMIVLLPLAALLGRGIAMGPTALYDHLAQPRVLAALWLSFRAAIGAAAISGILGLLLAWVLARYRFPGRRLLDAAMDLPFALPTAVAGIALTALYAPTGAFGSLLAPLGIKVAYTELGIWIALIFVGLPFVVRSLQPVIEDLDLGVEEASATLGASRIRTLTQVVLPVLTPALSTGCALALARAAGEYGSVIFIAGNLPKLTEIAPLLIVIRLEEFDYDAAAAIGLAMLAIAFVLIFAINAAQSWSRRRTGHA